MQYDKQKDGTLLPLAKKNVDTGWGLERNLAFLNGVDDVYRTDLFAGVIAKIEEKSGIKYDSDEKATKSMRIIADHLRTGVMLIGDEAKLLPSNGGPGYVLRRLLRRAVRHGRALNLSLEDMLDVASIYIDDVYSDSYPLLTKNKDFILNELKKEIVRFEATLENGMKEFKKISDEKKTSGAKEIDGKSAFYLYDTFGFPYELTLEMAEEEGLSVDEAGFKESMDAQKKLARENANFSQKSAESSVFDVLPDDVTTTFTGYETLEDAGKIVALADSELLVNELSEGSEGTVVVDKTPFYATMGGQKGDVGIISINGGEFEVYETVKLPKGRVGHVGKVVSGTLKVCEKATLKVDKKTRQTTCMNHSATHLLQAALQEVLGKDVHQQGSYQDPDRTRFDFSYGEAVSADKLAKIEAIVNEKIGEDLPVNTQVMSINEAKATGAMALFGEKYGDSVRVVSMGDFSKELCGGTHVKHTGEIRMFKVLSESGIAAGVRRIEAVTGDNVMAYYKNVEETLNAAAKEAKTNPSNLVEKIAHLNAENKSLSSEIESLKAKAAKESLGNVLDNVTEVKGVKLLAAKVPGIDMNGLRDLSDSLCDKMGGGVVVLASDADGKVNLVAKASDDAVSKGAHAGNLIKAIAGFVGGGGGGRPNMAQAGGKDPSGIDKAVSSVAGVLEGQL
jgi:alanyl-tRNA synthetase